MQMKPSNFFLDKYISFELSKLTQNNIPKLQNDKETYRWVNTFILQSAIHTYDESQRIFIVNILRRVESSFLHYEDGRNNLDQFLLDRQRVSSYFAAVMYFEFVLSHIHQAYKLGITMIQQDKLFVKGDNSSFERLNLLYNDTKHIEERINSGTNGVVDTLPICLTNDCIKSSRSSLSYVELFELMNKLESIAKSILK
jgi:hypothetical protein